MSNCALLDTLVTWWIGTVLSLSRGVAASEPTKEVTDFLITNAVCSCLINLVTEGCKTDEFIDPFKTKANPNCV